MGLEGRVALVTGAGGQGMGRSIALTLARDGADIVLNYHRKLDQVADTTAAIEAFGRKTLAVAADVSDAASVDAMFADARASLGHVDIVVNNAGGPWKPQDVTEIDPAHLRRVLAMEVEATYYLLRAALPGMRERGWGRFVSIGGDMAEHWTFGPPDAPLDYPLGKAARHWITRTIARRESVYGVTINAVAPGPTDRVALPDATAAAQGGVSGGDDNAPQDVANVVSFFCSDAAARVTGAIIPVPGSRSV